MKQKMKQRKIREEDRLKNALDAEAIIHGEEIDGVGDISTRPRIPVIDPVYQSIVGYSSERIWKGRYFSK